jgi:hypothetical protein
VRSVSFFADVNFANVVYRGPCIVPCGASAKGIGPIGFAFIEKINLLSAFAIGFDSINWRIVSDGGDLLQEFGNIRYPPPKASRPGQVLGW